MRTGNAFQPSLLASKSVGFPPFSLQQSSAPPVTSYNNSQNNGISTNSTGHKIQPSNNHNNLCDDDDIEILDDLPFRPSKRRLTHYEAQKCFPIHVPWPKAQLIAQMEDGIWQEGSDEDLFYVHSYSDTCRTVDMATYQCSCPASQRNNKLCSHLAALAIRYPEILCRMRLFTVTQYLINQMRHQPYNIRLLSQALRHDALVTPGGFTESQFYEAALFCFAGLFLRMEQRVKHKPFYRKTHLSNKAAALSTDDEIEATTSAFCKARLKRWKKGLESIEEQVKIELASTSTSELDQKYPSVLHKLHHIFTALKEPSFHPVIQVLDLLIHHHNDKEGPFWNHLHDWLNEYEKLDNNTATLCGNTNFDQSSRNNLKKRNFTDTQIHEQASRKVKVSDGQEKLSTKLLPTSINVLIELFKHLRQQFNDAQSALNPVSERIMLEQFFGELYTPMLDFCELFDFDSEQNGNEEMQSNTAQKSRVNQGCCLQTEEANDICLPFSQALQASGNFAIASKLVHANNNILQKGGRQAQEESSAFSFATSKIANAYLTSNDMAETIIESIQTVAPFCYDLQEWLQWSINYQDTLSSFRSFVTKHGLNLANCRALPPKKGEKFQSCFDFSLVEVRYGCYMKLPKNVIDPPTLSSASKILYPSTDLSNIDKRINFQLSYWFGAWMVKYILNDSKFHINDKEEQAFIINYLSLIIDELHSSTSDAFVLYTELLNYFLQLMSNIPPTLKGLGKQFSLSAIKIFSTCIIPSGTKTLRQNWLNDTPFLKNEGVNVDMVDEQNAITLSALSVPPILLLKNNLDRMNEDTQETHRRLEDGENLSWDTMTVEEKASKIDNKPEAQKGFLLKGISEGRISDCNNIIVHIRKEQKSELRHNNDLARKLSRAMKRLAEEMYTNLGHVIDELLQNADDNEYDNLKQELPTFHLILCNEGVAIINNENGFIESDVRALCDIGRSTKIANTEKTGKFGIGFKSVFKLTLTPHIFSNGFHFKFDISPTSLSNDYMLPHILHNSRDELLPAIVLDALKHTLFITPTTVVWLPFRSELLSRHSEVTRLLLAHACHFENLLFLRRLRRIVITECNVSLSQHVFSTTTATLQTNFELTETSLTEEDTFKTNDQRKLIQSEVKDNVDGNGVSVNKHQPYSLECLKNSYSSLLLTYNKARYGEKSPKETLEATIDEKSTAQQKKHKSASESRNIECCLNDDTSQHLCLYELKLSEEVYRKIVKSEADVQPGSAAPPTFYEKCKTDSSNLLYLILNIGSEHHKIAFPLCNKTLVPCPKPGPLHHFLPIKHCGFRFLMHSSQFTLSASRESLQTDAINNVLLLSNELPEIIGSCVATLSRKIHPGFLKFIPASCEVTDPFFFDFCNRLRHSCLNQNVIKACAWLPTNISQNYVNSDQENWLPKNQIALFPPELTNYLHPERCIDDFEAATFCGVLQTLQKFHSCFAGTGHLFRYAVSPEFLDIVGEECCRRRLDIDYFTLWDIIDRLAVASSTTATWAKGSMNKLVPQSTCLLNINLQTLLLLSEEPPAAFIGNLLYLVGFFLDKRVGCEYNVSRILKRLNALPLFKVYGSPYTHYYSVDQQNHWSEFFCSQHDNNTSCLTERAASSLRIKTGTSNSINNSSLEIFSKNTLLPFVLFYVDPTVENYSNIFEQITTTTQALIEDYNTASVFCCIDPSIFDIADDFEAVYYQQKPQRLFGEEEEAGDLTIRTKTLVQHYILHVLKLLNVKGIRSVGDYLELVILPILEQFKLHESSQNIYAEQHQKLLKSIIPDERIINFTVHLLNQYKNDVELQKQITCLLSKIPFIIEYEENIQCRLYRQRSTSTEFVEEPFLYLNFHEDFYDFKSKILTNNKACCPGHSPGTTRFTSNTTVTQKGIQSGSHPFQHSEQQNKQDYILKDCANDYEVVYSKCINTAKNINRNEDEYETGDDYEDSKGSSGEYHIKERNDVNACDANYNENANNERHGNSDTSYNNDCRVERRCDACHRQHSSRANQLEEYLRECQRFRPPLHGLYKKLLLTDSLLCFDATINGICLFAPTLITYCLTNPKAKENSFVLRRPENLMVPTHVGPALKHFISIYIAKRGPLARFSKFRALPDEESCHPYNGISLNVRDSLSIPFLLFEEGLKLKKTPLDRSILLQSCLSSIVRCLVNLYQQEVLQGCAGASQATFTYNPYSNNNKNNNSDLGVEGNQIGNKTTQSLTNATSTKSDIVPSLWVMQLRTSSWMPVETLDSVEVLKYETVSEEDNDRYCCESTDQAFANANGNLNNNDTDTTDNFNFEQFKPPSQLFVPARVLLSLHPNTDQKHQKRTSFIHLKFYNYFKRKLINQYRKMRIEGTDTSKENQIIEEFGLVEYTHKLLGLQYSLSLTTAASLIIEASHLLISSTTKEEMTNSLRLYWNRLTYFCHRFNVNQVDVSSSAKNQQEEANSILTNSVWFVVAIKDDGTGELNKPQQSDCNILGCFNELEQSEPFDCSEYIQLGSEGHCESSRFSYSGTLVQPSSLSSTINSCESHAIMHDDICQKTQSVENGVSYPHVEDNPKHIFFKLVHLNSLYIKEGSSANDTIGDGALSYRHKTMWAASTCLNRIATMIQLFETFPPSKGIQDNGKEKEAQSLEQVTAVKTYLAKALQIAETPQHYHYLKEIAQYTLHYHECQSKQGADKKKDVKQQDEDDSTGANFENCIEEPQYVLKTLQPFTYLLKKAIQAYCESRKCLLTQINDDDDVSENNKNLNPGNEDNSVHSKLTLGKSYVASGFDSCSDSQSVFKAKWQIGNLSSIHLFLTALERASTIIHAHDDAYSISQARCNTSFPASQQTPTLDYDLQNSVFHNFFLRCIPVYTPCRMIKHENQHEIIWVSPKSCALCKAIALLISREDYKIFNVLTSHNRSAIAHTDDVRFVPCDGNNEFLIQFVRAAICQQNPSIVVEPLSLLTNLICVSPKKLLNDQKVSTSTSDYNRIIGTIDSLKCLFPHVSNVRSTLIHGVGELAFPILLQLLLHEEQQMAVKNHNSYKIKEWLVEDMDNSVLHIIHKLLHIPISSSFTPSLQKQWVMLHDNDNTAYLKSSVLTDYDPVVLIERQTLLGVSDSLVSTDNKHCDKLKEIVLPGVVYDMLHKQRYPQDSSLDINSDDTTQILSRLFATLSIQLLMDIAYFFHETHSTNTNSSGMPKILPEGCEVFMSSCKKNDSLNQTQNAKYASVSSQLYHLGAVHLLKEMILKKIEEKFINILRAVLFNTHLASFEDRSYMGRKEIQVLNILNSIAPLVSDSSIIPLWHQTFGSFWSQICNQNVQENIPLKSHTEIQKTVTQTPQSSKPVLLCDLGGYDVEVSRSGTTRQNMNVQEIMLEEKKDFDDVEAILDRGFDANSYKITPENVLDAGRNMHELTEIPSFKYNVVEKKRRIIECDVAEKNDARSKNELVQCQQAQDDEDVQIDLMWKAGGKTGGFQGEQMVLDTDTTLDDIQRRFEAQSSKHKVTENTLPPEVISSIGRNAEEFLSKYLEEYYSSCQVVWVNRLGESGLPYDFVLKTKGQSDTYVELKATCTMNKSFFEISRHEWLFAQTQGDNYQIWRLFGVGRQNMRILR